MIILKSFKIEHWKYLDRWISSEVELVQFAGEVFKFPIDKEQVSVYLSDPNKKVFRLESYTSQIVGMAEINFSEKNTAKIARVLIGEKSMRGKGIGTKLIEILFEYIYKNLEKNRVALNVFTWNLGALKCYEKAGFYKTNKPVKIIKVGKEKWESIEMEKIL